MSLRFENNPMIALTPKNPPRDIFREVEREVLRQAKKLRPLRHPPRGYWWRSILIPYRRALENPALAALDALRGKRGRLVGEEGLGVLMRSYNFDAFEIRLQTGDGKRQPLHRPRRERVLLRHGGRREKARAREEES